MILKFKVLGLDKINFLLAAGGQLPLIHEADVSSHSPAATLLLDIPSHSLRFHVLDYKLNSYYEEMQFLIQISSIIDMFLILACI